HQTLQLPQRIGAQALRADGEREHLSGAGLVERQNWWRRFEEGVAAGRELGRVRAPIGERIALGEPADIECRKRSVEVPRVQIEKASPRATTQVLVAAANCK